MSKGKILLAEDDLSLGFVIKDSLQDVGFEVTHCPDGEVAWQQFQKKEFDICLLDINMPVRDGFSLAKKIRQQSDVVPIIFLTAKSLQEDKLKGFQSGADDYITKPFSSEELELRIGAILRRCQQQDTNGQAASGNNGVYALGKYTFDSANHELRIDDKRIGLTTKEVELLRVLYAHKNQLIAREKTLKAVWGSDNYFIGRSMDVFITKLRKYLKDDPDISIVNVHGTGVRLEVKE